MNKEQYELFMKFFNDPMVIEMANKELGAPLKLTFDWNNREIIAMGFRNTKVFKMDEMIQDLQLRN